MNASIVFFTVAISFLSSISSPSANVSLTEKTCILEAAAMLPAIPGLNIEAVASVSADKIGATQLLLRERAFSAQTALQFAESFGSMGADLYQRIRSRYSSGDYSAGTQLLQDYIVGQIETVLRITFKINAARQQADFSYDCFETPAGLRRVFPRGIR